jgi:hypothetical protein
MFCKQHAALQHSVRTLLQQGGSCTLLPKLVLNWQPDKA